MMRIIAGEIGIMRYYANKRYFNDSVGAMITPGISTGADFGTAEAGIVIRTQIIILLDQSV